MPAGFTAPAIQGAGATPAAGLAVGEGGAIAGGSTTLPAGFTAPAIQGSGATPAITPAVGEAAGAGGILGTGLTGAQALKLAGPAASLIGGVAQIAGGTGDSTTQASPETEALYQQLRELAARTVQPNQALALSGDALLRQRAAGSPSALTRQILPQIRELRQRLASTFQGLGQRLGPTGGKQVERLQGDSVAQTGAALQKLFANAQGQAVQDRLSFLQNLRPALLTSLPTLTQTTTPFDFATLGKSLAGGVSLAEALTRKPGTPAGTTPALTTPAFTPSGAANPYFGLDAYNAGLNPYEASQPRYVQ